MIDKLLYIFCFISIVMFFVSIFQHYKLSVRVDGLNSWIETNAIVIDRRIVRKSFSSGRRLIKKGVIFFHYRYIVNEVMIGSETVNFHNYVSNVAREKIRKLKPGDVFSIFYNPENPTESVLLSSDEHSFMASFFKMAISLTLSVAMIFLVSI